ncbi:hypothetical protein Sjap_004957 [Stephania japonica]|uniref:Carbohydrate kinase PfkB domain-containing protein n=1 Tax=Stephania japonica TaxID=461633 RepID=A0AAP0K4G5_9MAGN
MEGWGKVSEEGVLEVVGNALGLFCCEREIPDYVNIQVAKAARSAGVPVILDTGGMDGLIPVDLLTNVDIFIPNETELEHLTGMPTESFEQISQSVAKIHEMVSCSTIIDLDICSHVSRGVSNGFNNSHTNIARVAPASSATAFC